MDHMSQPAYTFVAHESGVDSPDQSDPSVLAEVAADLIEEGSGVAILQVHAPAGTASVDVEVETLSDTIDTVLSDEALPRADTTVALAAEILVVHDYDGDHLDAPARSVWAPVLTVAARAEPPADTHVAISDSAGATAEVFPLAEALTRFPDLAVTTLDVLVRLADGCGVPPEDLLDPGDVHGRALLEHELERDADGL
jgi:hypothetical protein